MVRTGFASATKSLSTTRDPRKTVTPTVIVNGESALDGLFRYESIAPIVLKAAENYTLAFHGDFVDPGASFPKGVVWAPEIRFLRWRELDGRWGYPGGTWDHLDVAVNFKFLPVSAASPTLTP